ncbi:hypothetical protein [Xenorhabdus sp. SGI246]|uniref:hypothetical protein n=1 Tax=Xenorhabdus sp. SGI246 TaxID=3158263 RepID=UPI00349F4D0E
MIKQPIRVRKSLLCARITSELPATIRSEQIDATPIRHRTILILPIFLPGVRLALAKISSVNPKAQVAVFLPDIASTEVNPNLMALRPNVKEIEI